MMTRHSLSDGNTAALEEFLGQQGEVHNRQESADSGLGMGSNFNLGSIPEVSIFTTRPHKAALLDSELCEETNMPNLGKGEDCKKGVFDEGVKCEWKIKQEEIPV
jgi:hypothetical protein